MCYTAKMTKESKEKLHRYFKKVTYFWIGVIFIIFGLIGFIFPIIPGLIPIFIGLGLVKRSQHEYSEHRIIKFLNKIKEKFQNRKFRLRTSRPVCKVKVKNRVDLNPRNL
jgi:hypothetical protein